MFGNRKPVAVTLVCEANPSEDVQHIDRNDWDALTPDERHDRIESMLEAHVQEAGGSSWHIDDENDYKAVGTPGFRVRLDRPAIGQLILAYGEICHRHGNRTREADDAFGRIQAALYPNPR